MKFLRLLLAVSALLLGRDRVRADRKDKLVGCEVRLR